jgi:hypothetical protein
MKIISAKLFLLKTYENNGTIKVYESVDRNAVDYPKILACCKAFAKQGKQTVILPTVHKNDPLYKVIYKDLIGTVYEKKCPDFMVDGKFYELEGFTGNKRMRSFRNMITRGCTQSDCLVIEDCGISRRWAEKNIGLRVTQGAKISEVWILEKDLTLTRLF